MNRALVQQAFSNFFDRAACAMVADGLLLQTYLRALRTYIAELELTFDPIDRWSIEELERAAEFLQHNQAWITEANEIRASFHEAFLVIEAHRQFLQANGLLPEYMSKGPENPFKADDRLT